LTQCGAGFNEADLVPAEQAQGRRRFVLRTQRPPGMTVGCAGIGQAPGIVAIGLAAGWALCADDILWRPED